MGVVLKLRESVKICREKRVLKKFHEEARKSSMEIFLEVLEELKMDINNRPLPDVVNGRGSWFLVEKSTKWETFQPDKPVQIQAIGMEQGVLCGLSEINGFPLCNSLQKIIDDINNDPRCFEGGASEGGIRWMGVSANYSLTRLQLSVTAKISFISDLPKAKDACRKQTKLFIEIARETYNKLREATDSQCEQTSVGF